MNRNMIITGCAALLVTLLPLQQAAAFSMSRGRGGSMSHSFGSTSHSNRYGGSTSHRYGEGTEHTNAYGGGTAHAYGGGTAHENAAGGVTAGRYGEGAVHAGPGGVAAYHPPTAAYAGGAYYHPTEVNVYHPAYAAHPYYPSCYNCSSSSTAGAAAAGLAVGMVAGAAAASANTSAATSAAYSAGVAAGSTHYTAGTAYVTLPAGCANPVVQGKPYYLCGNTWFQPNYGANGVYYIVVPGP
jgi:hypothetical protein